MNKSRQDKAMRKNAFSKKIRRFFRRNIFSRKAMQGSVTILLVIIMAPMLIFACSVVDLCKMFMAQNSAESALALAANSGLASYDKILKDMYGILAQSANEEELSKNLSTYYKVTLENVTGLSEIIKGDDEEHLQNFFAQLFSADISSIDDSLKTSNSLLTLATDSIPGASDYFSFVPIATSGASNPEVMHKQIVEYMKYRGPVYMMAGAFDKIKLFSDISNQTKAASAQVKYDKDVGKMGETLRKTYEYLVKFMEESEHFEQGFENNGVIYSYKFGTLYQNGKITIPQSIKDYLAEAAAGAYICSVYGGLYNKNNKLERSDKLDADLSDEGGSSITSSDLRSATSALTGFLGSDFEKWEKLKDLIDEYDMSMQEFIDRAKKIPGADNMLKELRGLFGDNNGVVADFLDSYVKARKKLNKQENDNKEVDSSLKSAVDAAADYYIDLSGVADDIEDLINRAYSAAKSCLGGVGFALSAVNEPLKNQIEYTTRLNDKVLKYFDDNLIEKSWERIQKLHEDAVSYKSAIDNVETASSKSGFQQNYDSSATKVEEMFQELQELEKNGNSKDELKEIIAEAQEAYVSLSKTLGSIKFGDKNVYDPPKDDGIYNSTLQLETTRGIESFLNDFLKNKNSAFSLSTYKTEAFVSYVEQPYGNSAGFTRWDDKNEAIKNNPYFKFLEKYGAVGDNVDSEKAEEAEEAKEKITDLGDESQTSTKETESEKASEEKKDEKFIPKNYPTYENYINGSEDYKGLKQAYDGKSESSSKELAILDDNAFSWEPTGDESVSAAVDNLSTDGALISKIGDDDEAADGAADALDSVGDMFANLLTATRDKLYITEYLTENFTCVTTENDETMMSGYKFYDDKPVVFPHSELEYILYGNMTGDKNEGTLSVVKASAIIFGVRFALNLVFALTNAELKGEIAPIVSTICAPVPFTEPIVQTVVLIGLALAESGIDLADLLGGKGVPLFKRDIQEWSCRPSKLLEKVVDMASAVAGELIDEGVKKAKEAAIEAENKAIDKLKDIASDKVKMTKDELISFLKTDCADFVKDQKDNIVKEVYNAVMSPFSALITDVYNDARGDLNKFDIKVEDLQKKFDSLKTDLGLVGENGEYPDFSSDSGDDVVKQIEVEVCKSFEGKFGELAGKINGMKEEIFAALNPDQLTAETLTGVNDVLDKAIGGLEQKVTDAVEKASDKIVDKIADAFDEVQENITEFTEEQLDKLDDNLKKSLDTKLNSNLHNVKTAIDISSKDNNVFDDKSKGGVNLNKDKGGVNLDKDNGSTGSFKDKETSVKTDDKKKNSVTIDLTYKDYLYVFTLIGVIANEDNMLMRAAQLMSANVTVRADGTLRESLEKGVNLYEMNDKSYDLNKAYTLFMGQAGAKTRTIFFGTRWDSTEKTFVRPASNVYSYTAKTYAGY